MLVRPKIGAGDAAAGREIMPGDLIAGGESLTAGAIATAGDGTWTGAAIATGLIRRTGPGAGYTDTTDTSTNILAALSGNNPVADIVPGTTFRMLFQNTVAFALTFAAGAGVKTGTGTLTVAASLVREYLWTVLNATPQSIQNCSTTNGSAVVTFNLPANAPALPMGTVTPGMTVTGAGIAAGTTVLGLTLGQGGITGVTLSANATATNNPIALTFMPTLQIDGIRSSTL